MATPIKLPSTRPAAGTWPAAAGKPGAVAQAAGAPADLKVNPTLVASAVVELRRARSTGDVLGVAWVHGAIHFSGFRRQTVTGSWESPTPVRTFAEFSVALDAAILELKFTGTEVFFILAHDEFVHQAENAPAFAEKAAHQYLQGRVDRMQQEREPMLWVSQRASAVKKEGNYILHLLPVGFCNKLNDILLARRLDLTRVLPLHVPLQLALSSLTETRDMPLLVATEAGSSTAVLVGKTGSEILFARTILESWRNDPARVAVEINRSMLYAKQQFGATVDFLWLLGRGAEEAQAEVVSKCGAGTDVVVEEIGPVDWLKSVARLPARHPVNLMGSFLRDKRRGRFLRRIAVAACWLGVALLGFEAWNTGQSWSTERARLESLLVNEENLRAEQTHLAARNAAVARDTAFVQAVVHDRLPPVASKFVAYVAAMLPREGRLTSFNVRWSEEDGGWSFRLEGSLEADPETASSMTAALRRQFATGPFRARILDEVRAPRALVVGNANVVQRFTLEGTLFEN